MTPLLRNTLASAMILTLATGFGSRLFALDAEEWAKASRVVNTSSEDRVPFVVEGAPGEKTPVGEVWIKKEIPKKDSDKKEIQLDTRTREFGLDKEDPYLVLFKTTGTDHLLDVTLKIGSGKGETRVHVVRDQSALGDGDTVTVKCHELKDSKVSIDLSGFRDTKGGTFLMVSD